MPWQYTGSALFSVSMCTHSWQRWAGVSGGQGQLQ